MSDCLAAATSSSSAANDTAGSGLSEAAPLLAQTLNVKRRQRPVTSDL